MSKPRRPLWPEDPPPCSEMHKTRDELRAYRVNDASRTYSLSRATLYRLIKDQKLRAVKVGGRRLILREDLEALVTGGAR